MYFIHTPKCGGKYVEHIFEKYIRKSPTLALPAAEGHLTYCEYLRVFEADHVPFGPSTFKFSSVRNPWDWHVSWYHFLKSDPTGRNSGQPLEAALFQTMPFADYIRWLDDPSTQKSPQRYQERQLSDWFINEAGQIAVDKVLRQETLEHDLRKMVKDLGLAVHVSPGRPNWSAHDDYRTYYDNRAIEIVARRHQRDVTMFGYSFEGAEGRSRHLSSVLREKPESCEA